MLFGRKEDIGVVVSSGEAHQRAMQGQILLVDVRSPYEWRETGVPQGAYAITMHQDPGKFRRQLRRILRHTKRPVAFICASGARTTYLQKKLRQAGFSSLLNVAEGVVGGIHGDGWIKHGLPLRQWRSGADSTPRLPPPGSD